MISNPRRCIRIAVDVGLRWMAATARESDRRGCVTLFRSDAFGGWRVAIILSAFTLLVPAQSTAQDLLIKAKRVITMNGDVLEPGEVLVSDGRIKAVGESLDADSADIIEVDTLMPGLVNAYDQTGISGQETERTREVTPRLATADIINMQDRAFFEQLSNGTTTINICPGTDNVISGLSCAVKTAGPVPLNSERTKTRGSRIISPNTGLVIAACSDPTSRNFSRQRPDSIYVRQPTNRMGVVWILRSTFHRAKTAGVDSPNDDLLRKAIDGEQPIFAVSRTHYDIRALLNIGEELGFAPVIVGGEESWRILDALKKTNTSVILGSIRPGSERGPERTRVSANNAGLLHRTGVVFCYSGSELLEQARFGVRFGLDPNAALAAITLTPAKILKIDNRVGSIAVGKDADLVALNGDPLEFTSSIEWVMVDGQTAFRSKHR
jgi:imidazolonepropionase-like amidohydrolase